MTATVSPSLAVTKGRTTETQTSWTVNFNLYSNDILFLPFSILLLLPRVTKPKSKVDPGTEAKTHAKAETEAEGKFKNNFPNLPQRFVLCLTHFHKARTETGIVRKQAEIIMRKTAKTTAAANFQPRQSSGRTKVYLVLCLHTQSQRRGVIPGVPRCSLPTLRVFLWPNHCMKFSAELRTGAGNPALR